MNTTHVNTDRMNDTLIDVPRGLTNVAVTDTEISQVQGVKGYYQYRDRSAIEVAETSSFEAAWQLLVHGEHGDGAALRALTLEAQRTHSGLVHEVAESITRVCAPESFNPVVGLKAALPIIAQRLGMQPLYDLTEAERKHDVDLLIALTPQLLARFYDLSSAQADTAVGTSEAGLVAGYLTAVTGQGGEQGVDPAIERALTAYLVAAMEHGFNASTFTARVIASTGADAASCIAGALGSLTGPLHGGAPSRALDSLDAAARTGTDAAAVDAAAVDAAAIEAWVRGEVDAGRRLMGFGHPVYRTTDPRSRMLAQYAEGLGGSRVQFALEFERIADRVLAELKPGRALHANVEFYASVVMERCGIPREMFTATFAVGRVVGWAVGRPHFVGPFVM